jgi:hypothetical protein
MTKKKRNFDINLLIDQQGRKTGMVGIDSNYLLVARRKQKEIESTNKRITTSKSK